MALKAVSAPLGSPVGGSGTPGTIPVWSGSGTTLTDSGLQDNGTSVFTNTRRIGVNTTSTLSNIKLQVGDASSLANYQGAPAGIVIPTGNGNWLEFAENSASGTFWRISKDSTTGVLFNSNGKDFGFVASSYQTFVSSAQLVLKTTGNVGIGTASPTQKLDVRGASAFLNAGTDGVYGDIAFIGSSSYPTTYLHKIKASVSNTTTNALLTFALNSGVSSFTDVMTLRGDGNVGIGTASPSGRLHVVGGTATSGNGTPITLIAQSGQASGNTNGGNIVLTPGSPNGSGTPGLVDLSSPSGTGLKLPATPGNADTQTLDAYQENTWTPTLTGFGGTTPTVTSARYTRVGRTVTCAVVIGATGGAAYSSTWGTTTITAPIASGEFSVVPCAREAPSGSNGIQQGSTVYLPTTASSTAAYWITWTYQV